MSLSRKTRVIIVNPASSDRAAVSLHYARRLHCRGQAVLDESRLTLHLLGSNDSERRQAGARHAAYWEPRTHFVWRIRLSGSPAEGVRNMQAQQVPST